MTEMQVAIWLAVVAVAFGVGYASGVAERQDRRGAGYQPRGPVRSSPPRPPRGGSAGRR